MSNCTDRPQNIFKFYWQFLAWLTLRVLETVWNIGGKHWNVVRFWNGVNIRSNFRIILKTNSNLESNCKFCNSFTIWFKSHVPQLTFLVNKSGLGIQILVRGSWSVRGGVAQPFLFWDLSHQMQLTESPAQQRALPKREREQFWTVGEQPIWDESGLPLTVVYLKTTLSDQTMCATRLQTSAILLNYRLFTAKLA